MTCPNPPVILPKQKPRRQRSAIVNTPTAVPIPTSAADESPDFFLGPELESLFAIAVAVGVAGGLLGRITDDVALKDE